MGSNSVKDCTYICSSEDNGFKIKGRWSHLVRAHHWRIWNGTPRARPLPVRQNVSQFHDFFSGNLGKIVGLRECLIWYRNHLIESCAGIVVTPPPQFLSGSILFSFSSDTNNACQLHLTHIWAAADPEFLRRLCHGTLLVLGYKLSVHMCRFCIF